MNGRYSFYPRESSAFSLSYYANVSEIFTPQDTRHLITRLRRGNRIGCLVV